MKRKLLATLLAGAVGLLPAAVHSSDASSDDLTTTHITSEVPLTAPDVDELAKDLGITSDEAELRLTLERASVGFEPALWEAFPDTFGGAWLEVDGPPGLTVALTHEADEALSTIRSMFSVPEAVRTVTVAHSYAELVELQERMIADRTLLQLGDVPEAHVLATTAGVYDLDIDVQRSLVVVHLPDLQHDLVDAFYALY